MKKSLFLPLLVWYFYYRTVLSGNNWLQLELEPKLCTKVEPEPKINNFGSATLPESFDFIHLLVKESAGSAETVLEPAARQCQRVQHCQRRDLPDDFLHQQGVRHAQPVRLLCLQQGTGGGNCGHNNVGYLFGECFFLVTKPSTQQSLELIKFSLGPSTSTHLGVLLTPRCH